MLVLRIIIYVIVAFLGLAVYVRLLEFRTIFLPEKHLAYTPADINLGYEDIFFKTTDGLRLNGWFLKTERSAAAPTLLFCHGNAGNIGHRLDKISLFHDLGLNVFIFDYRGYGKSQGAPSEQGLYRDAQAAHDYLTARDDIDREKIVVYGDSLGGVAAVDLAARKNTAALILNSTFSSARDMASVILPIAPGFLLKTKMDNVARIKQVTEPKLMTHSPEDEIVPYALGRKLFDAAPEPKEFLEIFGDHNEGYAISRATFSGGIKKFLQQQQLL